MPVSSTRPSTPPPAASPNRSAAVAAPHAAVRGASFHHVLVSALARPSPRDGLARARRDPRAPTSAAGSAPRTHAHGEPPEAAKERTLDRDAADGDSNDDRRERSSDMVDALDPAARQAALLAPPPHAAAAPAAAALDAPRARMSMEELLPALVRRIAWAGDKHRGSVRLEIGAGAYAGTTIVVHSDAGRVRVELSGAGDLDGLRRSLDARLRRHGLDVESVT